MINSSVTSITIGVTYLGSYYTLPSCVATATSLVTFSSDGLAIDDLSYIPSASLMYLVIGNSRFTSSGISGSGIDSTGALIWDDVWNLFPSLVSISIAASGLHGSLPSKLPPALYSFAAPTNQLSGTIPPAMLSSIVKSGNPPGSFIQIALANNQITGSIPESLFSGYNITARITFVFSLVSNQVSGSLPPNLFVPMKNASLGSLSFQLGTNNLTGSIPANFLPTGLLGSNAILVLDLSNNQLSGPLPATIIGSGTTLNMLNLLATGNQISGSLPPLFFSGLWGTGTASYPLTIDLSSNQLSGTIPATWISIGLSSSISFSSIELLLYSNQLIGTIPETLFYRTLGASVLSMRTSTDLYLQLYDNNLEGSLPSSPFQYMSPLTLLYFQVYDNPLLTGSIPTTLLTPVADTAGLIFDLHNTSIYGSPPSKCWASSSAVALIMSNMLLNGTIPSAWRGCSLARLDLSYNPYFAATIPDGILNTSSLTYFAASHTPLSGTLPTLPSSLLTLDLSDTDIEFCDSPAFPTLSSSFKCSLLETLACNCEASYTLCSTSCPGPQAPLAPFPNVPQYLIPEDPEPVTTPEEPPVTIPTTIPVSVDTPITSPVTSTCSDRTRPSADFTCINDLWTSNGTTSTIITIASGSGTVLIAGNLTMTTTLIFSGYGSTVLVNGSILNINSVIIELSPTDAKTLGSGKVLQILINSTLGGANGTDLSAVTVNSKVTSGCRKVKAEKVTFDNGKTLGAYLSVDSSGCKTWWIILVSVLVSLIVIVLIVLVLLTLFCKPFREKVRPYSARRPQL